MLPKSVVDTLILIKHSGKRLPAYKLYRSCVKGKKGLEIGGPSSQFRTTLPLYPCISDLDGVNVFQRTLWEGQIAAGKTYNYFRNRMGTQYISDATDLSAIAPTSYDFLLSSNCLEHIANPLRALTEWKRVVRIGGAIVLILPNPKSNFDHQRPVTSFEHLVQDFQDGTTEDDLTHLDEVLALHDLSRDPKGGTMIEFRARSIDNYQNRALHHHVFDLELIARMLTHAGFSVRDASEANRDFYALAIRNT
jgi:SAM-dependent methyltransferase